MGILYCQESLAKDVLLAETKVLYKSENVKAQLWGNKVNGAYANNLNLVLKREDGSVITGYIPDVKGGYGANLKAIQVKSKDEATQQLLMTIRQGDWRAYSEYRLLDFAEPKNVKQLFNGVDSFGIVTSAKLDNENLIVQTVKDKEPIKIELNPKMIEDISDNRRQVSFGKMYALTAIDIDQDGVNELVTNQQITVDGRILADVGAIWRYIGNKEDADIAPEKQEETNKKSEAKEIKENKASVLLKNIQEGLSAIEAELKEENNSNKDAEEKASPNAEKLWKQDGLTIMKSDIPNRKNSINNGTFFAGGMVYPVKMISPNGEATYPQIMLNENLELEGAWNKVLMDDAEEYIRSFLKGKADLAFNVIRADKKLITIQLISGKNKFVHHNISFIPGEKGKYELTSLLNTKSKDLVELLNVLNKNENVVWDADLTDEWYIRDNNLYLMKNVNDNDEVSGFALGNLKKYIKDVRFIPQKEEPSQNYIKKDKEPEK